MVARNGSVQARREVAEASNGGPEANAGQLALDFLESRGIKGLPDINDFIVVVMKARLRKELSYNDAKLLLLGGTLLMKAQEFHARVGYHESLRLSNDAA